MLEISPEKVVHIIYQFREEGIADRAAAVYAPIVHTIAIATFLGWGLVTGDWHVYGCS